jgi:putative transferase (TIGR04331 family)
VVKKTQSQLKTGVIQKFKKYLQYQLGHTQILGISWSGLLLSLYVNLLPKSPSCLHFLPNPKFCPQPYFPASYLNCLKKLIDSTFPESCLEGFEILAAKARELRYVPGRLRLGDPIYWNDQEKVMVAFARQAGEKLLICQHGGEYGMLRYNMLVNEIDLQSTIFISWGWKYDIPTGSHVLPLPSPFHSKIKDKHKFRNNTLIVIGQTVRINLHRIHWTTRINFAREYCNDTVKFLQSLNKKVISSVVFRPYAHTINNIEVGDIVTRFFPEIPFLKKDLNKALMKCRLVVLPSYQSTMNITMAANTPTVVYMPPTMMVPRKESAHFFELLKRCGIAHDSPGDAAHHVNQVWDDVEGWWYNSEVQNARKIWVSQYAKTDRFWWWHWIKALAQLKNIG